MHPKLIKPTNPVFDFSTSSLSRFQFFWSKVLQKGLIKISLKYLTNSDFNPSGERTTFFKMLKQRLLDSFDLHLGREKGEGREAEGGKRREEKGIRGTREEEGGRREEEGGGGKEEEGE